MKELARELKATAAANASVAALVARRRGGAVPVAVAPWVPRDIPAALRRRWPSQPDGGLEAFEEVDIPSDLGSLRAEVRRCVARAQHWREGVVYHETKMARWTKGRPGFWPADIDFKPDHNEETLVVLIKEFNNFYSQPE
jgi:hypothetical protein